MTQDRRVVGRLVHVPAFVLGSLLVVEVFTRFTFAEFFFPIGVEPERQQDVLLVYAARKEGISSPPSMKRRVAAAIGMVVQG